MRRTNQNFIATLPLILVLGHPSTAHAATSSLQEIYNGAQAAFARADWATAISGFEKVAKPDTGVSISYAQAIIRARLAQAYAERGDAEPALVSAQIALKGLTPDDVVERANMWFSIATAKRYQANMTEAVSYYDKALAEAEGAKLVDIKNTALFGKAQALVTVDPAQSVAIFKALTPSYASDSPSGKLNAAHIQDLIGRAMLNMGNPGEALKTLKSAGSATGGMNTTRINHVQQSIRGDAAIAAQLLKDSDSAREYLTYTGAGHLPSEEWTQGVGSPPVCGAEGNLKPEDVAVVEFSIASDGHVVGAAPIYANRSGEVGATFANAVLHWHWNPEKLGKIDAFWRDSIRLELRCVSRPRPQELALPFVRAFIQWIPEKSADPDAEAMLQRGYVDPTDPRLAADGINSIVPLYVRLETEEDAKKRSQLSARLASALAKANAPIEGRAVAAYLSARGTGLFQTDEWEDTSKTFDGHYPNTRASAWLNLEYAIALERKKMWDHASAQLSKVLATPIEQLDAHDPVRTVATLHLAALKKRSGDTAGADITVAAAGLSKAQCSLVDVRPVATNMSISSNDFPAEAQRWGFDGYVRENFDINAEGKVQNVRTVIAYPPFVFGPATEKSVGKFRYIAPVIDGTAAGCDGHVQSVRYATWRP